MRELTSRGTLKRMNMRVKRSSIPGKMSGWATQFILDGVVHRKFFSDVKYGGTEAAYEAAIEQATAFQDEHEELLALRRSLSRRRSNASGVPGVFYGPAKPARGPFWFAYWVGPDGRRQGRKFSESLYGPDEAKRLAIEARAVGVERSVKRLIELCEKFQLDPSKLVGDTLTDASVPPPDSLS